MTSSPIAGSHVSHTKTGVSKGENSAKLAVRSPSPARKRSSKSRSPSAVSVNDVNVANRRSFTRNGATDGVNGHDESEAETVVLSDTEHKKKKGRRTAIKAEDDEDDDATRLSTSPRHRRKSSGTADGVNGSPEHVRSDRNGHKRLANGDRHDKRARDKSTSPRNRSNSKHSVASSDATRKSPSADGATSPTIASDRGRASSISGTRKRKIREEHYLRNIEPPRQRLKSDPAAKSPATQSHRGAPTSPSASSPGLRSHKRSASTQSIVAGAQGRRRREISAAHDRKQRWGSDTSSEASSSPQPTASTAQYLPASRTKRSSHRSMTSPARTNPQMGHPRKNVDKFGATRLAREGEKGNLDLVQAAYEAAPEELDQADFAGFAPLQKASLNGHADVVEFLINKGCRTDCHSKEHDTPLIDAVENGHLDVVKLLLDAGVNPHHQNKKGERAVDVLNQEEDNVDEIEQLLRKAMLEHASDEDGMSTDVPLTTRDLVTGEHRNDLLYVESTLSNLRKYAAKGDAVAVDHFLSSIAPDTLCVTGAARGGHEMVLNLLLAMPSDRMEKDPDPAKYNETPLTAAIGRGHLGILRILLDQDNFNPTRKNKEGKTYYELAEELKGPKWQQEVDLLKERYDAFRAKKQAAKKRSLGPHASEKVSKIAKLRSPRSPEVKRVPRTSSPPVPSTEAREGRIRPTKIKQEKSVDGAVNAPLKKMRADGSKSLDATKHSKKGDDLPNKTRRRRVVDEDSSDDEHEEEVLKKPVRGRRVSEVLSTKARKDAQSTNPISKSKGKTRRGSTSSHNDKENKVKSVDDEDEEMIDAPLPLPAAVANATKAKQHTPEPVRLGRIQDAEKEANRQRMAAERDRLVQEQKAAEMIEAKKREERNARLAKLPIALRNACERGANRPLHFSKTELGISMTFLPLHIVEGKHINDAEVDSMRLETEKWMMSFQAVGILGLPEMNIQQFFPEWETLPVTMDQRQRYAKKYDISLLSQDKRMPCEDEDGFDHVAIDRATAEAREKFLALDPDSLVWIKVSDFEAAFAQQEWLRPLTLTKSSLCMRIRTGLTPPRSFDDMIKDMITKQHQKALLTPANSSTNPSPKPGSPVKEAAVPTEAMDVDTPRKDEVAPASSGIV